MLFQLFAATAILIADNGTQKWKLEIDTEEHETTENKNKDLDHYDTFPFNLENKDVSERLESKKDKA